MDMSALTVAEGDGGAVDSPSGMALSAMAARDRAHNSAMSTSEHAALADASKTRVMPHTESCAARGADGIYTELQMITECADTRGVTASGVMARARCRFRSARLL